MSSKKDKSVSDIIVDATKEIKDKVSKDLKKVKKVLNEPLFPKEKENVPESKKEGQDEPKITKEENHKKNKVLKVLLWVLLIVIPLSAVTYITLDILIRDKHKSTYEDASIKNTEIIQKEYVDALLNMDDTFEFKLSEDDVNQMLLNSLKTKEVSKYATNAYLDIEEANFKWCFDLKVPVFTTRLVISTHLKGNAFEIDSMKIGKLNLESRLEKKERITDEMLNTLFKNASLPIESDLEHQILTYNPLKFTEYFDIGEVTSEIFKLKEDPNNIKVLSDSIGFSMDIRSVKVNAPQESEEYELVDELESALLNKPVNTLNIGEETTVLSVAPQDFSKWISKWCSKNEVIEEIKSDVTNKRAQAKVADLKASFENNHLLLKWTIKLGNIYLETSIDLGEDYGSSDDEFNICFYRSTPSNESTLQKILMDDFITNGVSKGYLTYEPTSLLLTFNFESVFDNSSLSSYVLKTARSMSVVNNSLEFLVTRFM